MAWRSPVTESSPELEIKVQPRRSDPHPLGSGPPRPHRPPRPPPQAYRPFKKWFPWLVPVIVVVNVGLFVLAMYLNDCPRHSGSCLGANFLGRFAFQNIHENPLLGPSSATWVIFSMYMKLWKYISCFRTWTNLCTQNMKSTCHCHLTKCHRLGFILLWKSRRNY